MLPGFLLFKLGSLRESAITRKKPAGIRNVFADSYSYRIHAAWINLASNSNPFYEVTQ